VSHTSPDTETAYPHSSSAGLLGEALNNNLAGSVLIVSASLGSIAAGIPLTVMAAPLSSAGGLALALESRQLRDYSLFVVGGAVTLAWFMVHHFWFLDVDMQVGGVSALVCRL